MFEIGTSLREARVRQGIDLPEAELATKVRAKYLRALEDEQFDQLPGDTYVKGFLRAYADYLGLDSQLYVDEYNSRYVAGDDEPPVLARRSARRAAAPRLDSRPIVLVLAAIAVITALVIAAFKFGGSNTTAEQAFKPAAATAVKKKQQRPVRRHQAPAQKPPARAPVVAHVSFTAAGGASWMRVRRLLSDGRQTQLFTGTLESGKTLPFQGRRLRVEIGRPANLVVTVNGHRTALPPGDTPTTVVVTPQRIVSAAAAA